MIQFADISEFQSSFDARAYRNAGNEVIICRVHNGFRADKEMPARIQAVRQVKFVAVGWYVYLVAGRDAATQIREAIGVIGHLLPNEFPIVDHEEGAGNQIARCEAACNTFDAWAGFPCTLYAGESFFKDHLGGIGRWRRPRWAANYLSSYRADMAHYPAGATFWQYSDRGHFTGLPGPVDSSVYPTTAQHFLEDVRHGAPAAPAAESLPAAQTLVSVVKQDGRIETFEEKSSGEIVHKWQVRKDGEWATGWQSLGKP